MSNFLSSVGHGLKDVYNALICNYGPSDMTKMKDLEGDLVLITGAGNGLGRLLAFRLAGLKCRLVLWDVDEKGNEETKKTCQQMGAEAHSYIVDISSRDAIYEAAELVKKEVGHVDILINNAGILKDGGDFLDKNDLLIEKTFQINTMAHIWMAKAFLPYMVETNSGHIVCICSLSGIIGARDIIDYSASKFGAFGFQEGLENEMWHRKKRNIEFTTVCPSYINTNMLQEVPLDEKQETLSPDNVADEIIKAIRKNQRILILPKSAYLLYAIKGLLPRRLVQRLTLSMMER